MTDNFNPHLMLGVFYLKSFLYIFIMIQENETLSVRVDMTYVNGRFNFQLFAEKEVKPEMLRAMLVGGVAFSARSGAFTRRSQSPRPTARAWVATARPIGIHNQSAFNGRRVNWMAHKSYIFSHSLAHYRDTSSSDQNPYQSVTLRDCPHAL